METIVDTLCTNMTGDKEQLRDIALISSLEDRLNFMLLLNLLQQEDVTVQLEALDILGDLLSRFGPILQPYHALLLDALLPQLNSGRQAVRKRTVVALGHLAVSCGSAHYQKMVGILVEEMRKGLEAGQANTYIQCCATVCKSSGQRFAEYLDQVVGMLLGACGSTDDDELKENTLQVLEHLINVYIY